MKKSVTKSYGRKALSILLCVMLIFSNMSVFGTSVFAEDNYGEAGSDGAVELGEGNGENSGEELNEVTTDPVKEGDEGALDDADGTVPEEPEDEVQEVMEEQDQDQNQNQNQDQTQTQSPEQETSFTAGALNYRGSNFRVNLTYDADAQIPEGAKLAVKEISQKTDVYEEYMTNAAAKVFEEGDTEADRLPYARFFDISIVGENGEVIEPAVPVGVEIDLRDRALKTEDVKFAAVHFNEENSGSGNVESVDVIPVATDGVVAFDAETFSVYGVVYYYTVDFYYTPEGAEEGAVPAEYHMNGGSEMMMSDLFDKLGITRSASDIQSVDFTDTSLVTFTKEGSDWKINSLKPFTTSETLTITFADGTVIVIDVEDATPRNRTPEGNIYWELQTNGTLTIRLKQSVTSGGFTTDRTSQAAWNSFWATGSGASTYIRTEVTKVIIKKNEKNVGINVDGRAIAHMFNGFTNLESVEIQDGALVGSPTNIASMFRDCKNLKTITGLEYLDTTKVTDMSSTFNGAGSNTTNEGLKLDLSAWKNGGKVYNLQNMFANSRIEEVILNNENFKTRPYENGGCQMGAMFYNAKIIKKIDMSNITLTGRPADTSSMTGHNTQQEAGGIISTGRNGNATLETVIMNNTKFVDMADFSGMFSKCPKLTTVQMTSEIPGDMAPDAVNMRDMFANSFTNPVTSGTNGEGNPTTIVPTLDVSGFGKLENIVNMDGFVSGCTGLKVLNISNLDNSHIEPLRSTTYHPTDYDVNWGREYGVETCTSLEWLIADNSKAWMTTNKKGLPGAEYFAAAKDSDIYFFYENQMDLYKAAPADLSNPGAAFETVATKRDYIDLMTDREETGVRANDTTEDKNNINLRTGKDLNTNGAGFLAPLTYHLLGDTWENVEPPYQETYYRIGNINESTPIISIANTDELVNNSGLVDTKTYTHTDWKDHQVIKNTDGSPVVTITYPAAAVDINGKYHDVIIKINEIKFTNYDSIRPNRGRAHDPNRYYDTDPNAKSGYFRPILEASKGRLEFKNYIFNSERLSLNKGDAGTEIDFDIEIKDALPNTSVLFFIDDLDVMAEQTYVDGKDPITDKDDWCYDTLPWENVSYDDHSEGIVLKDGNDVETIEVSKHTGLVKDTAGGYTYIHGTGSDPSSRSDTDDPSTGWSAFSVKANSDSSNYVWKSGVGCTTELLKETPNVYTPKPVVITPSAIKFVNNNTPVGEYESKFQFTLTKAAEFGANSVDYKFFDINDGITNINEEKEFTVKLDNLAGTGYDENDANQTKNNNVKDITFDTLSFGHPMSTTFDSANGQTGASFTGLPVGDAYAPANNPDFPDHDQGAKYNEHIARGYIYRIKEVVPDDAGDVLEYNTNHVTYFLKVVVSNPKSDLEMKRGIKAEVTVGRYYGSANENGNGADKLQDPLTQDQINKIAWDDYTQVIWSKDTTDKGKMRQEDRTVAWPQDSEEDDDQYKVRIDKNGTEYIKLGAGVYSPTSGIVYLDANNPYSVPAMSILQETKVGEVYPYDEQSGKYREEVGHEDKILARPLKVDGAQVKEDVHGQLYIKNGNKFFAVTESGGVYSKGDELEVTDGTDGTFNPVDEDKDVEVDWEINGNKVRVDAFGQNYYKEGNDYYDPGTDPENPTADKFGADKIGKIGDVVPDEANDEYATRDARDDVNLIVTHTDGKGYPVRVSGNNTPYYKADDGMYYSVVGTILTPGANGFNPSPSDEPYNTQFDIYEDSDGTYYYKSDGKYYDLSGALYVPKSTEVVDRTKVYIGAFNNRIKVSDITVKKESVDASGNKNEKSGKFEYEIEFTNSAGETVDVTPTDYQFSPASSAKLTKVSPGKFSFVLEDDQEILIYGIPFQTSYKITEKVTANGWEFVDATQWDDTSNNQVSNAGASRTVEGIINVERTIWDDVNKVRKDNPNYKGQYDHVFSNRFTELLVKKEVVDGDTSKEFSFEATVKVSGLTEGDEFSYGWMDKKAGNKHEFAIMEAQSPEEIVTIDFTLKGGEDIALVVPLNSEVTIEETSPGEQWKIPKWKLDTAAAKEGAKTAAIAVGKDMKEVTFINTMEAELHITKAWDDDKYHQGEAAGLNADNNQYQRPNKVNVNITAKNEKGKDVPLPADKQTAVVEKSKDSEDWKTTIVEGLPAYFEGSKVTYTVTEVPVVGFKSDAAKATVAFDESTKKWIAKAELTNNPAETEELNAIVLNIKKIGSVFKGTLSGAQFTVYDSEGSEVGKTAITEDDGMTLFKFTKAGVYTIKETTVPYGYEAAEDFKVEVDKKLVSIKLVEGGDDSNGNGLWSWIYDLLFGKKDETETNVTIEEEEVSGAKTYTVTVEDQPLKGSITLQKEWDDNDDQDGLRDKADKANKLPKVKLQMTTSPAPGEDDWKDVSKVAELKDVQDQVDIPGEDSEEVMVWKDLPAYDDEELIRYRVVEIDQVDGYEATYEVKDHTYDHYGFTLTEPRDLENPDQEAKIKNHTIKVVNTHKPETARVDTIKIWEDNNNNDGTRINYIQLKLTSNATSGDKEWTCVMEEVSLTAEDGKPAGEYIGTVDLPVYEKGKLIEYTLTEIIPDNSLKEYEQTYVGTDKTKNNVNFTLDKAVDGVYTVTVTNKYVSKKANVIVKKVWQDSNDIDGLRAEAYAGDEVPSVYLESTTTPSSPDSWKVVAEAPARIVPEEGGIIAGDTATITWADLPVFEHGDEVYYRVREKDQIKEYGITYEPEDHFWLLGEDNDANDVTVTVINRHVAPVELPEGSINVKKLFTGRPWKDSDQFEFALIKLGKSPMPENAQEIDGIHFAPLFITNKDTAEGEESYIDSKGFETIVYNWDDLDEDENGNLLDTTFVYAIRELTAVESGLPRITSVTYSAKHYRLFVTVGEKDGVDELEIKDMYYAEMHGDDAKPLEEGEIPVFHNNYDPESTTYHVTAEKQYEYYGGENKLENKYEFVLKPIGENAEMAPMPAGTVGTGKDRTYTVTNQGHLIEFEEDDEDGLHFTYKELSKHFSDEELMSETGVEFEYEIYEVIPEGFTNNGDGTYIKITDTEEEYYKEIYDGTHHLRKIVCRLLVNDNDTPDDATDDFHELDITSHQDDHNPDFWYTDEADTKKHEISEGDDIWTYKHGYGSVPIFHNQKVELRRMQIIKEWDDSEFYSDGNAFTGQNQGYTRPSVVVNVVGTGQDKDGNVIEVYNEKVTITGQQENENKWTTVELSGLIKYMGDAVPELSTHDIKDQEVEYTVTEVVPEGFDNVDTGNWDISHDKLWKVSLKNAPKVKNDYEPVTITIRKTDENTGKGLAGAVFTVTREKEAYEDTELSGVTEPTVVDANNDGTAEFTFDRPGVYKIKETTAPTGYVATDEEFVVAWIPELGKIALVDDGEDGKVWSRGHTLKLNEAESTKLEGDAKTGYTLTVENPPIAAHLTLTKTWKDDNDYAKKRMTTVAKLQKKVGDGEWVDVRRPNNSDLWAPVKTNYENGHGVIETGELPAYENGQVVMYRAVEQPVQGYKAGYDAGDGVYHAEGKGVNLLDEKDATGNTAKSKSIDIENVYVPNDYNPATDEGKTLRGLYDTDGSIKSHKWKPSDSFIKEIEDLLAEDGIEDGINGFVLLDPSKEPGDEGYECTSLTTDEGTYTIDPETGEVTFTPKDGFTGTATTVTIRVKDEMGELTGKYSEAKYTPAVVNNLEEATAEQDITYTYLTEDGEEASKTVTRKLGFRRIGTVNEETGEVSYEDATWVPADQDTFAKEDSPKVRDGEWTPDVESVDAKKIDPNTDTDLTWDEGTKTWKYNTVHVIYHPESADMEAHESKDGKYQSNGVDLITQTTGTIDFSDQLNTTTMPDGSSNRITSYKLIDPSKEPGEEGYECDQFTTEQGTYKLVVKEDGTCEVLFTPDEGFEGEAETVRIVAKDTLSALIEELGDAYKGEKYFPPSAVYTPTVVHNKRTTTVTRTVIYTYRTIDGELVTENVVQELEFFEIGTYDPENPKADEKGLVWAGNWKPVGSDTFPAINSPIVDKWTPDAELVPAQKVTNPEEPFEDIHVIYQKTYWVTYIDSDGVTIYMEKTTVKEQDPEPDAPADPTKTGYTFKGWDRSEDEDGNITYVAKWEPIPVEKTYWVTYVDPDGVTIYMEKTTVKWGDPEPKGPADPTKTGYTFSGWNRSVDENGNITYVAKWTPIPTPQPKPTPAKTGDSNNMMFWGGLLVIALMTAAMLKLIGIRRRYR